MYADVMQESEHYLIDLVTGLVKEYVQEEDCLIMLAMTMKGLLSFFSQEITRL